tara:strand:+ start:596 stop:1279 length:684 start_codon:yes stop_codon:yes gene_type:complete
MKFLSTLLSEARGSINGATFSRNSSGAYIRSRVKPVNPNTPAQSAARALFATLSAGYKSLSQSDILTWEAARPNFPQQDKLGQTIELTAQQLYMKFNRNLQATGSNVIDVAPSPATVTTPSLGTVTVDNTQFSVAFTPDPLGANELLVISASRCVSAGVNFMGRSGMKQILVEPGTTASPSDIFDEYNAIYGGGTLQAGSKVFVSLKIIDRTTGISSDTIMDNYIVA